MPNEILSRLSKRVKRIAMCGDLLSG
ncbi:MAG: hypothetical protein ACK5LX_12540 [Oscillospiraceae bacterium]